MNLWWEKAYLHMPVCLQNMAISLYGVAYRQERLGGRFEQYTEQFIERERWSPSEMQAYLDERVASILVRSFQQCPYYREHFSAAGIRSADLAQFGVRDLPSLPITPKQNLRKDPDAFIAADARASRLHTYYTSGSTGTPIKCVYSSDAHRRFYAAREARSFGWAGTSLRSPRSMLGGRVVVRQESGPPFYRYNWAERQLYLSAYHISPSGVSDYVKAFERYRPELLTGYAHSHYVLARMMLDQGLSLSYEPKAAVLGSEKLTGEMKDIIHRALHVRVYEEYGSIENCVLATECEAGSLHVNPDFGVMEIVDDQGLPAPPGSEGRILCTGMLNDVQPLIRYDIGDLAAWSPTPCVCGRDGLPVLRQIVGRLEDSVLAPDGHQTKRFHGLFYNLPSVVEGQVIQEELDLIRLRVVADSQFGIKEQRSLTTRVRDRLGNVRVTIELVSELPRTERGKFRGVISNLTSHAAHAIGSKQP